MDRIASGRDLDPMLSYPSTILGKERAIVVNLEHIKAIITAAVILMINSTNPLVAQFVLDLTDRISTTNSHVTSQGDTDQANRVASDFGRANPNATVHSPVSGGPKLLPFEFKALEVCLESACRCHESETQTLEEEAYPALDELTSQIITLNLERVRQIKNRLVALSGRVQKPQMVLSVTQITMLPFYEEWFCESRVTIQSFSFGLKL